MSSRRKHTCRRVLCSNMPTCCAALCAVHAAAARRMTQGPAVGYSSGRDMGLSLGIPAACVGLDWWRVGGQIFKLAKAITSALAGGACRLLLLGAGGGCPALSGLLLGWGLGCCAGLDWCCGCLGGGLGSSLLTLGWRGLGCLGGRGLEECTPASVHSSVTSAIACVQRCSLLLS